MQNHMSPETVIDYQFLILLVLRRGKKISKSKTEKSQEENKVKPSLYILNRHLKIFILGFTPVLS